MGFEFFPLLATLQMQILYSNTVYSTVYLKLSIMKQLSLVSRKSSSGVLKPLLIE